MAKSNKEKTPKKSSPKETEETPKKSASKSKKEPEDDEDEEDDTVDETPKKGAKASSKKKDVDEDEEDEDVDDPEDDWNKVEEDDNWDPDFDEFDLPKSKTKKSTGTPSPKKPGKAADDDDLGIDDEFKDMDLFNDRNYDEDDDDF